MGREIKFAELWRSDEPMMSLRDRRHSVFLQAMVAAVAGAGTAPTAARVRNISSGGVMAECRFVGSEGDRVELSLRGLGELTGSVAWACENRIGVMFDEPIDVGKVLRQPTRGGPETYTPRPAPRPWRPALHCS